MMINHDANKWEYTVLQQGIIFNVNDDGTMINTVYKCQSEGMCI